MNVPHIHPKIAATGIICVAIVLASLVYIERAVLFGGTSAQAAPSNTSRNTDATVSASNPTNNPTTNDWQKQLAQNIAQSDSSVQILTTGTSGTAQNDNSLTAQLSKQFFALYLADKKNGVAIDDSEAQRIAQQALDNISLTSTAVQYGVGDIKVSNDSSPEALNVYAGATQTLVVSHFSKNTPDPVDLLNAAVTSGNESDAAKIDQSIKNYQGLIKDTLKIRVPLKVVGYHVVYINTLSDLLADLQAMRLVISDPIQAYVGFTNYQKDVVTLHTTLQILSTQFSQ